MIISYIYVYYYKWKSFLLNVWIVTAFQQYKCPVTQENAQSPFLFAV